jgi:hypothetical protein
VVNFLVSFDVVLRFTEMTKNVLGEGLTLLDLEELLFLFHFSLINVVINAFFYEGKRVSFSDFENNFVDVLSCDFFI